MLGLVGAGGIGFYIQLYIRAFQYDKVATLTVVVLVMVIAIEQLSVWIRPAPALAPSRKRPRKRTWTSAKENWNRPIRSGIPALWHDPEADMEPAIAAARAAKTGANPIGLMEPLLMPEGSRHRAGSDGPCGRACGPVGGLPPQPAGRRA